MKMSLKKQIVLAFLILILTITSVDILCNRYLLDDYYLNNKETILLNTANKISAGRRYTHAFHCCFESTIY